MLAASIARQYIFSLTRSTISTYDQICFVAHVVDVFFVVQWNLVCDRVYLKDLTQTIFVVGQMIGSLICNILADKYGRKPTFLFSHWAMVVVGVANAFAPNYYVFLIFRFFTGVFFQVRWQFVCYLFDTDDAEFCYKYKFAQFVPYFIGSILYHLLVGCYKKYVLKIFWHFLRKGLAFFNEMLHMY